MWIKNANIKSFGKLCDKDIALSEGLNVVYGENGSGKSTFGLFLKGMFYGIKGKEERGICVPWDGKNATGHISYVKDGKEFGVDAGFGKTSRGDKYKVYEEVCGNEVTTDYIGDEVFSMGLSTFQKTAFISSGALISGKGDDEIAEKLSNLQSGGDEGVSFSKASSDIDSAMASLIAKRGTGGKIQKLESEIQELKAQLREASSSNDELYEKKESLSALYAEKTAIEQRIEALKKSAECERVLELKSLKDEIESLSCDKDLSGAYDDSAKLKELGSEKSTLEKQVAEIAEKKPKIEIGEEDYKLATEKHFKKDSNVLFYLLLLLTLGFSGLAFVKIWFVIGAGLTLGLAIFDKAKKSKSKSNGIVEKYGFSDYESFQEAYMKNKVLSENKEREEAEKARLLELESLIEAKKKRCVELYGTDDADEIFEIGKRFSAREERKKTLIETFNKMLGGDDLEKLAQKCKDFEVVEGATEELAKIEARYGAVINEISQNERKYGNLEGATPTFEIERRIDELSEKRDDLSSNYRVLQTIMTAFQESYEIMEGEFGAKLNDKAGEILKAITDNYSVLRMNKKYEVKLSENGEAHNIEEFSTGIFDQAYLSYRLAMVELMDTECPVVLDDALMSFDDIKAEKALSYLANCGRQVILFTCRKRDLELANRLNANCVEF